MSKVGNVYKIQGLLILVLSEAECNGDDLNYVVPLFKGCPGPEEFLVPSNIVGEHPCSVGAGCYCTVNSVFLKEEDIQFSVSEKALDWVCKGVNLIEFEKDHKGYITGEAFKSEEDFRFKREEAMLEVVESLQKFNHLFGD